MEKRITVSEDKCIGCRICELICSFRMTSWTEINPHKSAIRVSSVEKEGLRSMAVVCRQCEDPSCVRACPTGALRKTEDSGILFNEAACNGCGLCAIACPFNAIWLDGKARVIKCDMCGERAPLCIDYCPRGCINLYERQG